MDDVKSTVRDVKDATKEAAREVDGHQVTDDIGNAGDDIRRNLGNAGDQVREGADRAAEEAKH